MTELYNKIYFCACPKPGTGVPMSYVMVLFMFNGLRWDVIVCFVNNAGIVDHHRLIFLLITSF